jgi:hypothetical protein
MMQDIKYTKEVEPIILAYHNIFDNLCKVWEHNLNVPELAYGGEWWEITIPYENIDFERVQSLVLPMELRYLVPPKKQKSKRILERLKWKGDEYYRNNYKSF